MIKKLLILSMLLFPVCAQASDDFAFMEGEERIERDYFDGDKYNVMDKEHEKQGYIKKDSFSDDTYNIYNKDHEKIGKLERDPFNEDRWDIKKKGD